MGIEQNRLKLYRKSNGWTQKYMAERLGITQQRYQQWETAEEDMRSSTLKKICLEFNLNPSWLLGLSDEMEIEQPSKNEFPFPRPIAAAPMPRVYKGRKP